ncbi:hypothetical protein [Acrocarpospora corrugata]|nr:hypothetical protein [Acrocarpospora corrugata]
MQDNERHLAQLEELRALLQEQHAAAVAELGAVTSESGDQLRLAAHAAEIEAAIERMDRGLYGTCRRCGAFIPLAVLFRAPQEQRCPGCAEQSSTMEMAV